MAIPDLQEKTPAPSWLEPVLPKSRGLDLLGLRVPVGAIGTALLNGITTATPAVRYFSLRTWLLWVYVQARQPDDWESFREFAVDVECCIALGNNLAEINAAGVVGSDRAAILIRESSQSIDLQPLVDTLAIQNYANPSSDLGLTYDRPSKVPGLYEERALPLATAVNEIIGVTEIGSQLASGKSIHAAQVDALTQFGKATDLSEIPNNERSLLVDFIMPAEPLVEERNRLSTYTLLLFLSHKNDVIPTEQQFFLGATATDRDFPQCLQDIRDGWLQYLIRDCLAIGHEASLAAVINTLEDMQPDSSSTVDKNEVLERVLLRALAEKELLMRCGLDIEWGDLSILPFNKASKEFAQLEVMESPASPGLRRWQKGPNEWDIGNLALASELASPVLLPFIWLLACQRIDSGKNQSLDTIDALSYQGLARVGMEQVVIPGIQKFSQGDYTYADVMSDLVQRTVDQHLRIAWTRLRFEREPKDVAVLTSDGSRWCRRKSFHAGRTASRLEQAIRWLSQLELIDKEGITDSGERILERSLSALEKPN